MDDHHNSLPLGEGLHSDHSDPDWDYLMNLGNFEDMPGEEIDRLFGREISPSYVEAPSDSQIPPSQDAPLSGSLSPEDTNIQFTPSSTAYDLPPDDSNLEDLALDLHTDFTNSPIGDFELISPYSSRSSGFSHVSQSFTQSLDGTSPSVHRSRESTGGPAFEQMPQQWPSFDTQPSDADNQVGAPLTHGFNQAAVISAGASSNNVPYGMTLSHGNLQEGQAWTSASLQSTTYGPSWGSLHEPPMFFQQQPVPVTNFPSQHAGCLQNIGQYQSQINPATRVYTVPVPYSDPPGAEQSRLLSSQPEYGMPLQYGPSPQLPDRTRYQAPVARATLAHSTRRRFPDHPAITAEQMQPTSPRQKHREIAVANPENIPLTARPRDPQEKSKQGGRKKHSHLNQDARDRSSKMRKLGACWRCKMQRDPCPDDGTPCGRCIIGSQKGQLYFFECNRSKLPDFVMDFLPPSYTIMHSKQNIEDCVKDQVRGWDYTRPVEVCLTSGYGHPLRWILYEFEPATLELLGQYQYLQNVNTRQSERREKWSPPLGITKLEPSDEFHFKNYLDDLMADEPLAEFPWICFEEESLIDDFQATMLAMICELYRVTSDFDLKQLLRRIIHMLIVTYIMGHTLTITEDTLPMVHTHLRSAYKPANLAPHTSPRLANRQLKFFFNNLRDKIYEDILKWQQATLHTSGGKDTTWLSTFIVMLAFAMVLEEIQRTIQIQADAKWGKRERFYDEVQQEASNACERIDERFRLLIGLFQCKYRDKKWVRGGSFGPQTPRLRNAAEHNFCVELRSLLEERQNHLRSRKDVPFSSQTQCQYTTRLVARFLLPFLELPG